MKNLSSLILTIILLFPIILYSQAPADNLYYVVIGAFANPRNANDFIDNARSRRLDAQLLLISERKLHYIHILGTPERNQAISLALKLQSESTYSDAWVFSILAENGTGRVSLEKEVPVEEKVPEVSTQSTEPITLADGSKPFIFKLKSINTGNDVAGDVDIFDADVQQGRKVTSYRGNDVVKVKPINKSGNMAVICDVFGYRKVQLPINFNQPKYEDALSLIDGNIVVNFDLVRLKKGDKVIMYNVYFFNHAAIMRPESRYEVNALLEFLQEKPTSKIKIHGHANGNDFGKIITLGKSTDYYTLSRDNKEGKGSSIKLSEERARIIQSYLVSQGIDINRMEIKAWGGKMPIYEKDHMLAQANLRVEIEILEE